MKKYILSTIGAVVIGLSAMAMAPTAVHAAITVSEDGKFTLSGTVRARIETDRRENTGAANQSRIRPRLRLRLGGAYQANENWSLGFRLASGSNSMNSPHQTLGLIGATDNSNFGLDRAYIKYKNGDLSLWAGKNSMNLWTQTEVFWDGDIQPEGVGVSYKLDPATFNVGYFQITSPAWGTTNNDVYLATAQAVVAGEAGDVKLKGGASYAGLTNIGPQGAGWVNSEGGYTVSLQAKTGDFLLGGEYFQGSNSTENTAFTAQGRYEIGGGLGIRVYYYDIEAYALPADGLFSQDNFPSANANAVNFQGWRFQVDYKVVKNVSMDLRVYTMEAKTIPAPTAAGIFAGSGNIMSRSRWTRIQWNTNIKF